VSGPLIEDFNNSLATDDRLRQWSVRQDVGRYKLVMPEFDHRTDRWPENVRGQYYVDCCCLDCDLCREVAPKNFTRNYSGDSGVHSYVYKQPDSPEEEIACRESREGCPHDAIHDDGIEFD
jgi:ferredoxin